MGQFVEEASRRVGRGDEDCADAHVEDAEHLGGCDVEAVGDGFEDWGLGPGRGVDEGGDGVGEDALEVFFDAAAGDVGGDARAGDGEGRGEFGEIGEVGG